MRQFSGQLLLSHGSETVSYVTRGSVAKTPYFLETISCRELITGESWRSGRNSGLDGLAKKPTIPNEFRESPSKLGGFEIRADSGRVSYDERPFPSSFS